MYNAQTLLSVIPALGLVFAAGTQVNRIDELFGKAYALERENEHVRDVTLEIHQKVTRIETILDERLKP